MDNNYLKEAKSIYIVQKYIEKPFLLYGHKFDMRQWVMVTSHTPLRVWVYNQFVIAKS